MAATLSSLPPLNLGSKIESDRVVMRLFMMFLLVACEVHVQGAKGRPVMTTICKRRPSEFGSKWTDPGHSH
ncbi:hypothetical protein BJV77DRAFT_238324 [Russula vinacea]|nr:hypothetical protein BJV77DRAFT_238324 [Russula vinacea]